MKKLLVIAFVLLTAICAAQVPSPSTPQLIGVKYEGLDGIDRGTNTLQGIDYSHHEIHAGKHFYYQDAVTLASAASQTYVIKTPNTTEWAHLTFQFDGSAITTFELYEGSQYVASGSVSLAINNDRNSANVSSTTIYKGSVASGTIGTLIRNFKGGAAQGAVRAGSTSRADDELILKQNTTYLFRAISGTADNLVNVKFMWYTHTNKN